MKKTLTMLLTAILVITSAGCRAGTYSKEHAPEDTAAYDEQPPAPAPSHPETDEQRTGTSSEELTREDTAAYTEQPPTPTPPPPATDEQIANLHKLCKVWGFAKYTHPAFLLGQTCWDEELLRLIPIIIEAGASDVNGILYEWFIGLGDGNYDLSEIEFHNDSYGDNYVAIRGFSALTDNIRTSVCLDWTTDAAYLGEPLAEVLTRFIGMETPNRTLAPVLFDSLRNSSFPNEKSHYNMDYGDNRYRLLGLFRLWNVLLYYYPHMDIIDYDWDEMLMEHIATMLKGTNRGFYVNTLLSLAAKLDDAHAFIDDRWTIDALDRPQLFVTGNRLHLLLEGNIGLINPSLLRYEEDDIPRIMDEFRHTDGLIVDLRQYPGGNIHYRLAEYIVEGRKQFVIISVPSQGLPGVFVDLNYAGLYSGGLNDPQAFYYDKPVVLLMNRRTSSSAEFAIMSLRNGKNVTVMGSNSIGADGNVTGLALPGNIPIRYTGQGIYTPEGGQTHRIGLSPDIYIEESAQVIDGRDMLMDAAVEFILGR